MDHQGHRPTTNQRDKHGIGVIFCSGAASSQIYCSSSEEIKGQASCQSISPTVNLYYSESQNYIMKHECAWYYSSDYKTSLLFVPRGLFEKKQQTLSLSRPNFLSHVGQIVRFDAMVYLYYKLSSHFYLFIYLFIFGILHGL